MKEKTPSTFCGAKMEQVSSFKFLGINIDLSCPADSKNKKRQMLVPFTEHQ